MLRGERRRRRFVVDREGDDLDAGLVELGAGAREGGELGVAIGAPGAAIDQHDAERAVEIVGQLDRSAADLADRQAREAIAVVKQRHGKFSLIWTEWSTRGDQKLDCQVQLVYRCSHEAKRSTSKRLTARGAATRRRIVAAAADLALKRGVGETSLDDVMAASGASKSQLYHYFADKDELLREAAALQAERVLAAHGPLLEALDSLAAMRRWRDAVLALNRRTGCPLGALVYQLPRSARARADGGRRRARRFGAGGSRRGSSRMQARGELAPDAAPADIALAVLSAVQGGLLLSRSAKSDRPLELAFDMALAHVAAQVRRPADRSLVEPPRSR